MKGKATSSQVASFFTDNFYERLQQDSTFHMIFLTSFWSLQSSLFIVPLLFTLTGSPSSPPMRAAGRRQLISFSTGASPARSPRPSHPTSHFFYFQSLCSQNKDILFLSILLLVRPLIVLIWSSCALSHDTELSRNLITSHWLSYQLHDLITPWLKTWHQRKIQAAFNMFASRPSARD